MVVLGGWVGLGAATASVGRVVGVGVGCLGFLPRGMAASMLSDPNSNENLRFFEGERGGGSGCG